MSQGSPDRAPRVALVFVDPVGYDSGLAEALSSAGATASFFVRPENLVLQAPAWRSAISAGHELGIGTLLGVTDDGRLRNWTCEAISAELKDEGRLLRDLGMESIESIFLPGARHVCAEGSYRSKAQRAYPVCIGEDDRICSLNGERNAFDVTRELDTTFARDTAVLLEATAGALERVLRSANGVEVGSARTLNG